MAVTQRGASRPATKLQRQLAEDSATRRPTALDAFKLARRWFLAGRRIDMSGLADELGVNRVTLYRWVGSREQLLVEVVWSLAERTLERADDAVVERGPERVVQIVMRFIEAVIANTGMRHWLSDEGDSAMRLLTRSETDFQRRLIDWLEGILRQEADAGRLDLPVDLHEVAYVLRRLIESYVYLDIITGEQPDASRAEPVLRLLLR